MRNPFGNIAAPPQGYIWDFAKRANVSVRSYGEFGAWAEKGGEVTATGARARRPRPSFVSAVRLEHSRRQARRRLAGGVQEVRAERHSCRGSRSSGCGNDHTSGTSPGMPHAARDGRRQRPRARPARRGDLAQRASGTNRRSSCSRTTRRTGRITSTRIARSCSRSARSAGAASSTARSTRRRACCARWS